MEWNAKGCGIGLRPRTTREARGASGRMRILTLARAVGIRSDWPEDAVRFPLGLVDFVGGAGAIETAGFQSSSRSFQL